jgi:hypothetical protein
MRAWCSSAGARLQNQRLFLSAAGEPPSNEDTLITLDAAPSTPASESYFFEFRQSGPDEYSCSVFLAG